MARKFYTCIIVPDAREQLHKLRIPIKALYILAAIGALSFFVAVGLGFHYISMASRMANFQTLEAENAKLKVDVRQSRLDTSQLSRRIDALETEAERITRAIQEDPVLRKLGKISPSVGGSMRDVPTSELLGNPTEGLESLKARVDDLSWKLPLADEGRKRIQATPRIWPLNGRIVSQFGSRFDPFTGTSERHLGTDIAAPRGTPIKATADGKVLFSRWQAEYGNLVVLEHPNGITTRYGHLSTFKVKEGQTVHRGDLIGSVGMTGRATAPHLHYEVRLNDAPVNPKPYLLP